MTTRQMICHCNDVTDGTDGHVHCSTCDAILTDHEDTYCASCAWVPTTYFTISGIKQANTARGHHFFDASSMRFFRSKIASKRVFGGRYFITSEQFDWDSPRLYTIREAKPDGRIETVQEFQKFATVEQAKRAAEKLVKGGAS
jgi:hypothetical protein